MRLFLTSFRLGNHPQSLVNMVNGNRKALVIANGCDLFTEDLRQPRVDREIKALAHLGFTPEELDLRQYFDSSSSKPDIGTVLASCGLIWVRGGNAFVLRRAMRQSGFEKCLPDLLQRDALVYGGYSGGIAVLGPTLRGIERVSDPNAIPAGYDPAVIWEGLGILTYSLASHYRSEHSSSPGIEKVVQYWRDERLPFKTLRDGETMVVSGDQETFLT